MLREELKKKLNQENDKKKKSNQKNEDQIGYKNEIKYWGMKLKENSRKW